MAPTSTSHSTFLPNIWLQRVLQALGPWWLRQVPGVGRAVFGFLAAGGIPSCLPKEGGNPLERTGNLASCSPSLLA